MRLEGMPPVCLARGPLQPVRGQALADDPLEALREASAKGTAHLCGERGDALFETLWARLLDRPPHELREVATLAAQMGWLEYRSAGSVTEITFGYLLRRQEEGR